MSSPDVRPVNEARLPGHATSSHTRAYAKRHGELLAAGHYSEFPVDHLLLSTIGIGTFPEEATNEVDRRYVAVLHRALISGLNVIDTAAHYRYGRAMRVVGAALREAAAAGVPREAVFLVSKGGFVLHPEGPPADPLAWFRTHVEAAGLGASEDLVGGNHCLSSAYLLHQLDLNRSAIGVERLDAFLIDQPEVHIPVIGKAAFMDKLLRAFTALEGAVRNGRIRCYGISSFDCFRAHTEEPLYLSFAALRGLAEKAARAAFGRRDAGHHLRVIQLPFNQAMTEGFTRFNQLVGDGGEMPVLQASLMLKVYAMASHTLLKGRLSAQAEEIVGRTLPSLANDAQRAVQFTRSTPGIGTALVGVSTPAHLDDLLAVSRVPPLETRAYLSMYRRVGA